MRYKFVNSEEYVSTEEETKLDAKYPKAPSYTYSDGTVEYLICGDGALTEQQMNDYKAQNWVVTEPTEV